MSYLADTAVVEKPSGSYGNLGQLVYLAPDPPNPEAYTVIRLSNGTGFYTAGGTTVSGGGVLTADQGSPGLLSSAWPVKVTDGSVVMGVVATPFWVTGTLRVENPAVPSGSVIGLLVGGQPVAGANPVPTQERAALSSSVNAVAVGTGGATVSAANSSRRGLIIWNNAQSTNVFLKLGPAATSSLFTVRLSGFSEYELPHPGYTGIVTAMAEIGTADLMVTELFT